MKKKHWEAAVRGLTIWTLLGTLLLASLPMGAAWAAAPGGTGPGDALVPANDWTPLESGGSVWYAFQYAGDGWACKTLLDKCLFLFLLITRSTSILSII